MDDRNQLSRNKRKWQAVVNREPLENVPFYYGVVTTGIYCRPGCSSRTPNRENVVFFESIHEAEQQGYRACRKCRPNLERGSEEREAVIVAACRRLEEARSQVTLAELADEAGLSPTYFHRLFKKLVGITPRQYYLKHRTERLQDKLANGALVGEAIFAAGFESLSGAYNKNDDRLAMVPKSYRKGGEGERIVYDSADCYLGKVLVAMTEKGICAVELGDSDRQLYDQLRQRFPKAEINRAEQRFQKVVEAVINNMDNPNEISNLPLDIQGTSFQQKVWQALRKIKPGETSSYSEIAEQIGKPAAVRAVAGACAANKIAVLIPCHRVLTKDKKISGYRWGTERKRQLLKKEQK